MFHPRLVSLMDQQTAEVNENLDRYGLMVVASKLKVAEMLAEHGGDPDPDLEVPIPVGLLFHLSNLAGLALGLIALRQHENAESGEEQTP